MTHDQVQAEDDGLQPAYTWRQYLRAGVYFNLYGLVKYLPSPIGDVLRAGVLRLFAKRIGTNRIKDAVTVWFPERLSVGTCVSINEQVYINAYGGVTIGNDCRIAHQCSIMSEEHGFDRLDVPIYRQKKITAHTVLEDDVWLGAGVRVTSGVRIGKGCVVGAGAVVTKDLPAYSIAVGVPAKVIGKRGERQHAAEIDLPRHPLKRRAA